MYFTWNLAASNLGVLATSVVFVSRSTLAGQTATGVWFLTVFLRFRLYTLDRSKKGRSIPLTGFTNRILQHPLTPIGKDQGNRSITVVVEPPDVVNKVATRGRRVRRARRRSSSGSIHLIRNIFMSLLS